MALIGLIGAAILLPLPKFTGSLMGFELENNWHFTQFQKSKSFFGKKEKIYLHLVSSTDDKQQVFKSVKQLTRDIKKRFPNTQIVSPGSLYSTMKYYWKTKDNSLHSFFSEAQDVPILNQLIAKNQQAFLMVITIKDPADFNLELFQETISVKYSGIASIKAISPMHIEHEIEHFMTHDIALIILLIMAFFSIYILVVFRNVLALVFTLFVVSVPIGITLFLFPLFHFEINLISILALPIVLILALSDAMHLLAGYVKLQDVKTKSERIQKVISHFAIPSFFSSVTTAAAFFTFYLFNDSPYIQQFGLITAIALMIEVFLTFMTAPFLLYYFNIHKVYDKNVIGVSVTLNKYRKPISIGFLVLLVISFFVVNKLEFKSNSNDFFPVNSEVYEVHESLKENFTSPLALNIFIKKADTSLGVDMRGYTKGLTERLKSAQNVVFVNSATNEFYFPSRIGFPVNLYDELGSQNPYFNKKEDSYHIELRFLTADDIVLFQKTQLAPYLENPPKGVLVTYSSYAILMDEVNQSVSKSLIKSLSTSGVVIFLIILMLTKSIKVSLFSLVPNIVPLAVMVVVFYVFSIHLNIITAITGVICLGLIDDDTIHILYRKLWLKESMNELSFSILSSAILLIVGFGFFLISSFTPVKVLGWVSALIFLIGVISELTIMQWVLDTVNDKK